MDEIRRRFILRSLAGAGGLGLRALATGLPIGVLKAPLTARAQDETQPTPATLLLNTSFAGEPINCNAPGMYGPRMGFVTHPSGANLAPTEFTLGGQPVVAAKPWADLGPGIHSRLACIHHATYTGVHARQNQVMRLMGNTRRSEMFPSIFAKNTGPRLQTVQVEPLSLGAVPAELISFSGRTLANVSPLSLKKILGGEQGPLQNLQSLRDRDLDALHNLYKREGSAAQRTMLDRFAISRQEARSITNELVSRLDAISDDEATAGDNQIIAAAVLAAMNVSPVITLRLDFGGDNHFDDALRVEATKHTTGFRQMSELIALLDTLRTDGALRTRFVVATLGVFGRTFDGANGRAHNSAHHVTMLIGDGVRPGVYGGCEQQGAMHVNAATGEGLPNRPTGSGIVPFAETLQAAAKTIGALTGVPRDVLDLEISGGAVIEPVVG